MASPWTKGEKAEIDTNHQISNLCKEVIALLNSKKTNSELGGSVISTLFMEVVIVTCQTDQAVMEFITNIGRLAIDNRKEIEKAYNVHKRS